MLNERKKRLFQVRHKRQNNKEKEREQESTEMNNTFRNVWRRWRTTEQETNEDDDEKRKDLFRRVFSIVHERKQKQKMIPLDWQTDKNKESASVNCKLTNTIVGQLFEHSQQCLVR